MSFVSVRKKKSFVPSKQTWRSKESRVFFFHRFAMILLSLLLPVSKEFQRFLRLPPMSHMLVDAKEVIVTKEWQLLGEDDTIPAGMHVRMDLSTGEKWVKLPEDDDNDKNKNSNNNKNQEHVVIMSNNHRGEEGTKAGVAVSIHPDGSFDVEKGDPKRETEEDGNNDDTKINSHDSGYDYDMMHRTLSKLPHEEMEKYGGLPELPTADGIKARMTPEEQNRFERRMAEIWEKRQAELKEVQEQLLDVPEMLKERMRGMKDYLKDPITQLSSFNLEDEEEEEGIITNILSLLKDLEFQLSDLDNARDFHTMGGWEVLVMFLSEDAHGMDTTSMISTTLSQSTRDKIRALQSYAAWTIGTAVKNTEEFFPYAIEPVKVMNGGKTTTTALDRLMDIFCKEYKDEEGSKFIQTLQAKSIYAIGALVRGNRIAQRHLVETIQGGDRLGHTLHKLIQTTSRKSDMKLVQRLLSLASDLITDIQLDGDTTTPQLNELIISTFTTPQWCNIVSTLLTTAETILPVRIQETVIEASITMATHCSDWSERSEDHRTAVRNLWNQWEESKDDYDIEHLNQLKKQATQLRNLL